MRLDLIADPRVTPQLLEAFMLLCFGLAWPLANLRMLRNQRAEGKGLGFTLTILCGYLAGATAKLLLASYGTPLALCFWLYVLNAVSVGINLGLQWYFGGAAAARTRAPAQVSA